MFIRVDANDLYKAGSDDYFVYELPPRTSDAD